MPPVLSFRGNYPTDEDFWIATEAQDDYPLRYGDLFETPANESCQDSKGRPWRAVMALHPSCELGGKDAPDGVQVVRVRPLADVSKPQADEVRAGFKERDGRIVIARVNMVYLAPPPSGVLQQGRDLYADLRQTARVPLTDLRKQRIAGMTHDARVAVIARDLYFRYRWLIEPEAVAELEAARISRDAQFLGPRPAWASL